MHPMCLFAMMQCASTHAKLCHVLQMARPAVSIFHPLGMQSLCWVDGICDHEGAISSVLLDKRLVDK